MKKLAAAVLAAITPMTSMASDWEYSVMPYLWLPTISVESGDLSSGGGSSDVGPTNYLEALDFGFMMTGEARNDDVVLKGDYIYLNFGIDGKEVDFDGLPLTSRNASASLIGKVPTLLAGLTVVESNDYHMDLLVGWRRADLDLSIDLSRDVTFPNLGLLPAGRRLVDLDVTYDDFLLAVNGEYEVTGTNWSVPYYADIGTGDSDLTWQAMIGVDYAFDSWKLHVNYRHLSYDFGDMPVVGPLGNTQSLQNVEMVFSGPSIGAKFEF